MSAVLSGKLHLLRKALTIDFFICRNIIKKDSYDVKDDHRRAMDNKPIFFEHFADKAHWPTGLFEQLLIILVVVFVLAFLLYKLQLFFKKSYSVARNEKIDNPADIKEILQTVMRQKSRFRVHLNARKRSFNSSLLEIRSRSLVIDSLFPEEGNDLIADSEFLRIDFTVRESDEEGSYIPYTFDTTFVRKILLNNYPALRIDYPEFLKRDQKRKYFRIVPPVNQPLFIDFLLDGKQVTEKIGDISAGGAGFYTNYGKSVLYVGRRLDSLSIALPGHKTINCHAIVHSIAQNENPVLIEGKPFFYSCGIEFGGVERSVHHEIIQYVVEKEREALKRMNRGFG